MVAHQDNRATPVRAVARGGTRGGTRGGQGGDKGGTRGGDKGGQGGGDKGGATPPPDQLSQTNQVCLLICFL